MFNSVISAGGLLAGTALLLSACSTFEPERFACNSKVTAVELGTRVQLVSSETSQPVEARLNGVTAQCYLDDDETVFEVSVGLKLTRDLAVSGEATGVQVPFVVAVVDGNEKVKNHDSFGYRMAFAKNNDSLYPVVEFEIEAPKDGRIILSMTTQNIDIN
ncbi:hypothetical protein HIMB100_00008330 [SAR116 cluster alpha proteobacterium HIMB100]|nr:hypothetical protein HIMB100_00008330 [SAR116 cluster alpha proteobacterium HIMB100]